MFKYRNDFLTQKERTLKFQSLSFFMQKNVEQKFVKTIEKMFGICYKYKQYIRLWSKKEVNKIRKEGKKVWKKIMN